MHSTTKRPNARHAAASSAAHGAHASPPSASGEPGASVSAANGSVAPAYCTTSSSFRASRPALRVISTRTHACAVTPAKVSAMPTASARPSAGAPAPAPAPPGADASSGDCAATTSAAPATAPTSAGHMARGSRSPARARDRVNTRARPAPQRA